MRPRVLFIGLDCIGAEVLSAESLAMLPTIRALASNGVCGTLKSTIPPITVPAWTSMVTGRDPGELGIYGFRNRRSYSYGDLVYASPAMVRHPRLWDFATEAGKLSLVVGFPQTYPPPCIKGVLVSGFDASRGQHAPIEFAYPPQVANEILQLVGEYPFDIDDFRNSPPDQVLEEIYKMTDAHFTIAEHFLQSIDWDLAMICEIGPDRLHHCFWSSHDPRHPRHDPHSPYRGVIKEYYVYLDAIIKRLLRHLDNDTLLVLASDHGAKSMYGGICINELLIRNGWLALNETPSKVVDLTPEIVDWKNTRAWGEGGYYSRLFLNICGRESFGVIPAASRDDARAELESLLSTIVLDNGMVIYNSILRPETIYRRTRGIAPDLLAFFGDLHWRSLGTIGHNRIWLQGNDRGIDEANHATDGFYLLFNQRATNSNDRAASILDITPTILRWMDLDVPSDLQGTDLLHQSRNRADA